MRRQPSVLEVKLTPKIKSEWLEFIAAVERLGADDPLLEVVIDPAGGGALLKGAGEVHLDGAIDCFRQQSAMETDIGAPQVAYREKLTKRTEIDYTHKKQTDGTGQFARVKIVFEPNEVGAGNTFESAIIGGAVPKEYVPGVDKGIKSVTGSGILAGFPVVDLKATLVDGAFHDADSSVLAFEIASRAATREALRKGGSVLLEPIMKVEVVTPEEYTGSVIGDLNSRRGQIQGQDRRGNAVVINAVAPLANMFGYVNQLRSFSQGRAVFTMQFDHYAAIVTPDDGPFRPAMAAHG